MVKRIDQPPRSEPPKDIETPQATAKRFWTPAKIIAGLLAAICVIGITIAYPLIDICEEQLADDSTAVKVCRNLSLDDPPVVAVGVVLLGSLSVFFTEISGFGITLKRQVENLRATAEQARELGEQNRDQIVEVGSATVKTRKQLATQVPLVSDGVFAGDEAIRDLAAKYNEVRLTMPSGHERTAEMGRIVRSMRTALKGKAEFDVARHLESTDDGVRLAAYAYLNEYPEPRWAPELVDTFLDREGKPFNQWWALRALYEMVQRDPDAIDRDRRKRLNRDGRARVGGGADRLSLLTQVLQLTVGTS